MSNLTSIHLKKIRLMGTMIVAVSILSLFLTATLVIPAGWLYAKFGDEINLAEYLKDKLPPAETGTAGAVDERLEALPTTPVQLKRIFIALCVGAAFSCVISIFLFMIGTSWRRSKPFSEGVVRGLRGLGITFLLQTATSLLWPKPSTNDAELSVGLLNGYPNYLLAFIPLTVLGLLLLALSWVLDNGRELQQAEELTI